MYAKKLYAGWSEMDFNAHMGGSRYLDKGADVRLMFFAENGYPVSEFARLRFGPVAMKDELAYTREVSLLQEITVTLSNAGMSPDGSRWCLRQDILRTDGKLCARITSTGGWMDLGARKLIAPPDALMAIFGKLDRTEDFVELPPSIKTHG
jgi:acyl-CoA thioester hydrolase